MSTIERVLEVAAGSVGHVPVLASGAMLPIGVAHAAATIGLGGPSQANPRKQ